MSRQGRRWDVFCRVVDNFGDAAVCWRVARQLADEHGARVRLWIDHPETLAALRPDTAGIAVDVLPWTPDTDFGDPADIAIDAFGDGLPERYVRAMAARPDAHLWIKLEYLSAEAWVPGHHGLPSPHPSLPLRRFFCFPGFVDGTGGLLRERDLLARRDAFDPASFWPAIGQAPPGPDASVVSLFGYENPAVGELLQSWADGPVPVVAVVTESRLTPGVRTFLGSDSRRGRLQARFLPFLPQDRYDELLWSCDWNFVRGEDSFVRAQWAARPFAWQVYPQQEDAHQVKLEAFLALYAAGLEAPLAPLWRAWNGAAPDIGAAWQALLPHRERLRAHARQWAHRQGARADLVAELARFAENPLK